MGKIYRCCYTNASRASGGVVRSGWGPVAVSADLPYEAYASCVRLQSANSDIQQAMTDGHGRALNLLEFAGDGTYWFALRTQYGLQDRLGRPNMFSQAFIFPMKESDILFDPNILLTIDNTCFHDNEEAAAKETGPLRYTRPFTIESALQTAGLSPNAYITLVHCVYTQFADKRIHKPLYLQYSGEERQLRAILYCIYYALPSFLCKRLHTASCEPNNPGAMNLIFSESARSHALYCIPQTGENNILSPQAENRIARYPFIDYIARHYDGQFTQAYRSRLEQTAATLGDPTASNEQVLKIAHRFLVQADISAWSDNELEESLSSALHIAISPNNSFDFYLVQLLKESCSRRFVLTEENELALLKRLSASAYTPLWETGDSYFVPRLCSMPFDEASKRLAEIPENLLAHYEEKLLGTQQGQAILDHYFSHYAFPQQDAVTWQSLESLLDRAAPLQAKPLVEKKVLESAWVLYCRELSKTRGESALRQLDHYQSILQRLPSQASQQNILEAKREYWRQFHFQDFRLEDRQVYCRMAVEDCPHYQLLLRYEKLSLEMENLGFPQCLAAVDGFLITDGKSAFQHPETRQELENNICRQLEASYPNMRPKVPLWVHPVFLAAGSETSKAVLELESYLYSWSESRPVSADRPVFDVPADGMEDQQALVDAVTNLINACIASFLIEDKRTLAELRKVLGKGSREIPPQMMLEKVLKAVTKSTGSLMDLLPFSKKEERQPDAKPHNGKRYSRENREGMDGRSQTSRPGKTGEETKTLKRTNQKHARQKKGKHEES